MTPSPSSAKSKKTQTTKHSRNVLAALVLLQDLDFMIREASDPEQAEEESRLGFKVEGLQDLHAARAELAESLDRRVLTLYQVAASRYAGRAVAPVRNKVCLGCWAMQPTGFGPSTDRIVTCQSCGRILYPL